MNETQIAILGAFNAAMQTLVEVWENPDTSLVQLGKWETE
jgi:hypothetical protein